MKKFQITTLILITVISILARSDIFKIILRYIMSSTIY